MGHIAITEVNDRGSLNKVAIYTAPEHVSVTLYYTYDHYWVKIYDTNGAKTRDTLNLSIPVMNELHKILGLIQERIKNEQKPTNKRQQLCTECTDNHTLL